MSEEEEYYLGRAVAARLLSEYDLVDDDALDDYINRVGLTVAIHSDRPYTYGGYHFAVLFEEEINAFACPGGIVFITLGMIDALSSEDELAAVLAHEVAHVSNRDGVASIKKSRWLEVVGIIGTEAARGFGSEDVSSLATLLEGSVDDVFKTLVVKGYGREQEYKADVAALTILEGAGYDPQALADFLARLTAKKKTKGGLLKTHPDTKNRLNKVKEKMPAGEADESLIAKRAERFKASVEEEDEQGQ
jgi:predicted Zn-dependent protease